MIGFNMGTPSPWYMGCSFKVAHSVFLASRSTMTRTAPGECRRKSITSPLRVTIVTQFLATHPARGRVHTKVPTGPDTFDHGLRKSLSHKVVLLSVISMSAIFTRWAQVASAQETTGSATARTYGSRPVVDNARSRVKERPMARPDVVDPSARLMRLSWLGDKPSAGLDHNAPITKPAAANFVASAPASRSCTTSPADRPPTAIASAGDAPLGSEAKGSVVWLPSE